MNTVTINAFFDELEKIGGPLGDTLRKQMENSQKGMESVQNLASTGKVEGAGGGGAEATPAPPPPPPAPNPAADMPGGASAGDMGGGFKPPSASGASMPGALGAGDIPGGGNPMGGSAGGAPAAAPTPTPPSPGPATAAGRVGASQESMGQASSAISGGFQPGKAKSMSAADLGI